MYYRGAAAAVVVYDIGSAESFAKAQAWVRELQRQGHLAIPGRRCAAPDVRAHCSGFGLSLRLRR